MADNPQDTPVPTTPLVDGPDMSSDDHNKVATVHLSKQSDDAIVGLIGKLQTSAGIVYGAWPYPFTATTNASGIATVYLTSDGTSGGTAAFTTVYQQSVSPTGVGANNYNNTSIVISGDKKTMTITLNQISTILGLLTQNTTAAAGVVVQGTIWGK